MPTRDQTSCPLPDHYQISPAYAQGTLARCWYGWWTTRHMTSLLHLLSTGTVHPDGLDRKKSHGGRGYGQKTRPYQSSPEVRRGKTN